VSSITASKIDNIKSRLHDLQMLAFVMECHQPVVAPAMTAMVKEE